MKSKDIEVDLWRFEVPALSEAEAAAGGVGSSEEKEETGEEDEYR